MVGKIYRCLTGRIARADKIEIHAIGRASFTACGAIIDPLTDQPFKTLYGKTAPGDSSSKDHCAGADDLIAIEEDFARYWIDIANRTRYQYLRAKPPRLQQCAACEFVA